MYIFGSSLIKKHFNDFREPNDLDFVTNDPSKVLKSKIGEREYYYIPSSPNREMTPDEIYTLKVSHAIYDIHWKKTMSDIRFLQLKGCNIIQSYLNDLREYWKEVHGEQVRTDFEINPGDFFEDKVRRKINHDDLHKMLNPSPTYLKMINSGVTPDKEKYFNLLESERKELLYEEAFVIAIERFFTQNDRMAYQNSQKSLITRLHPVWLADQVIENWNKWYWNPQFSKYYNNYKFIKNKK